MFTIEINDGFYGVGAFLRVFRNGEKVATHYFKRHQTKALYCKVKPFIGEYDHKTRQSELSTEIPPVLLNALVCDPQAELRLPMGNRVRRLEPGSQELRFLEDVSRHVLHDGVIIEDLYLLALREERSWASGYYLSSSVKIKSILEVVGLKTGKKLRDEVLIPDVIDSRRFSSHFGWKIEYVWPVRQNTLIFETDNQRGAIHLSLDRLK